MSFLGCTESTLNNITQKIRSAFENPSLPEINFSLSSYQIGILGDNLAKRLHESRTLYGAYGALDGLSNICSHWRFVFDVLYTHANASPDDKLHEFLTSPGGMIFVGLETLAIMAYATIGNYFDKDDKIHPVLEKLVLTWPYLRDFFKGSKNTYKGIRATLNIASFLSGTSLLPLLVPLALSLGVFAIVNRLLLRYMYTKRKKMMKKNKKIWKKIRDLETEQLSLGDLEEQGQNLIKELKTQSLRSRLLAYLGATYGGFVDGLYLYVGTVTLLGVTGLVWLTMPVALCLIGCSLLYGLTNIVVRLYEEYGYQQKLDVSTAKAALALTGKKIEYLLNQEDIRQDTHGKLEQYVGDFKRQREELEALSTLSYRSAILLGITHGLSAYGALACFVFAISTLTFLIMHSLPPALMITIAITIASGLLLMGAFTANALYRTYQHRQELAVSEQSKEKPSIQELIKLKQNESYDSNDFKNKLNDCMVIDDQPLFYYMETFEIIRSFFSGAGKGPKSMMTTFNALQEKGDDGHYHFDSWLLMAFTSVSSSVYAVCLALRAYARGFGRPPVDQIEKDEEMKPAESAQTVENKQKNGSPRVSRQGLFRSSDTPPLPSASRLCASIDQ